MRFTTSTFSLDTTPVSTHRSDPSEASDAAQQPHDLARLRDAQREHGPEVGGEAGGQASAERDALSDGAPPQRVVEPVPDHVADARKQRGCSEYPHGRVHQTPEIEAVELTAQD